MEMYGQRSGSVLILDDSHPLMPQGMTTHRLSCLGPRDHETFMVRRKAPLPSFNEKNLYCGYALRDSTRLETL